MFIVWIVEPQRSAAHCIRKNAGNFNVIPMYIFLIALPLTISLSSNTANEYINQIRNWLMQCIANKSSNNRIDWACCPSFYGIIIWCTKCVLMRNIACIVVQYRQTHCPMSIFPNSMSSKVCVCPASFGVNGHYINYNGVFTFSMHTHTRARTANKLFTFFRAPSTTQSHPIKMPNNWVYWRYYFNCVRKNVFPHVNFYRWICLCVCMYACIECFLPTPSDVIDFMSLLMYYKN